jgi:hypothetical protein
VNELKLLKIEDRWDSFPPTLEDKERLARYDRNRMLYRSQHQAVYARRAEAFLVREDPDESLYSNINFCKLLSNKTGDNLFGEDSPLRSPSGNQAVNDAIEAISERSRLSIEEWKGAVVGSYCGEAILRCRFVVDEGCYIETVLPSCYFVEFDPADRQRVVAKCIAYVIEQDNDDEILYKEIYKKGIWKKEAWKLNGGQAAIPISDTGWLETGYPDGFLVWHVPNQQVNSYWGIDDYEDIIKLQDSLNNAMSRLERVLDKYSSPILVEPSNEYIDDPMDTSRRLTSFLELSPRAWETLNRAMGQAQRMSAMKLYTGDSAELGSLPRYVEWSADLTSRLAQIRQIIESMMMVTETNPTVLGLETTSGVESGWALSIKMAGFKAKVRQRQQNWHYALQEAMYAALTIENKQMGGPAPEKPDIIWSSGLPMNETEEIDNAIKMKNAGIASLETVIRKAQPNLTDAAVEEEIKRINEEKEEASSRFAQSAVGAFDDDDHDHDEHDEDDEDDEDGDA